MMIWIVLYEYVDGEEIVSVWATDALAQAECKRLEKENRGVVYTVQSFKIGVT